MVISYALMNACYALAALGMSAVAFGSLLGSDHQKLDDFGLVVARVGTMISGYIAFGLAFMAGRVTSRYVKAKRIDYFSNAKERIARLEKAWALQENSK